MPLHFKSDDSSSLRGNVEGLYGRLCLCPNCLLPAIGCSSSVIDLVMHVSGEFEMGLVVSGAVACTRLL